MSSLLAYLIAFGFIIIQEKYLRKSGKPKNFKVNNKFPKGTLIYVFSVLFVLLGSPILNYFHFGSFNNVLIGWLGIIILLIAVLIRTVAMRTLGSCFTRTLITTEKQKVVDSGIYKYVRHPGYAGTLLGAMGFSLAQTNWLILIIALGLATIIYINRIDSEEQMLIKNLGEDYLKYMQKTKRLVPFIY